ncbi:hypothetical protein DYL61_31040 [Pseudomonas nabeulensis]|uniref:Uncharacterized protein n=1 Tax=Pseudomonas nabeulensis TaxID=2293833 RepID=A0A4Z0AC93_9PSED|nr:hypothetical protein [Pseudomonas nabeulensis]TFY84456.1 hypothetical protein DYL61_31040 [Pseudomonas nabeulensis]
MEELIYKTVHWLGETYSGYRGRPTHRFEVIVLVALAIAGMISTALYRAKRQAFESRTAQAVAAKPLVAVAFSEENGQVIRQVATLREGVAGYSVSVSRCCGDDCVEVCSQALGSMVAVEAYLRGHTVFVLADFSRQDD